MIGRDVLEYILNALRLDPHNVSTCIEVPSESAQCLMEHLKALKIILATINIWFET